MVNVGLVATSVAAIGGAVIMFAMWAYEEYQRNQNQRQHRHQDSRETRPKATYSAIPPQPSNHCVICCTEWSAPLELLPCGHLFHRGCIKKWFIEQLNCPVCRARFTPEMEKEYRHRLDL
ncbi:uncharacterized protein LOC128964838 [Oppia nitens]|uniref:uncharacterized protein LOC128964838 n=1 Tax=Oppia nitens TaxID=1686743 RepID=UPI0023DB69D9|nr:uncharacterized protein LOC128964838 [Oppia nitens]